MSQQKRFKTRTEFARELGVSRRTLYTIIREAGLELPRGLLSPETQAKIWSYLNREDPEDESSGEEADDSE